MDVKEKGHRLLSAQDIDCFGKVSFWLHKGNGKNSGSDRAEEKGILALCFWKQDSMTASLYIGGI